MQDHNELMSLSADKRREFFRKAYTLEMGRAHVANNYRWPIEKLPEMVDRAMAEIAKRRMPSGAAVDATMKFFGLKTQKAVFAFLEY
jgi:hypothetical protein